MNQALEQAAWDDREELEAEVQHLRDEVSMYRAVDLANTVAHLTYEAIRAKGADLDLDTISKLEVLLGFSLTETAAPEEYSATDS